MTTQKEIDNTFIATLESIIGVCDKTTSGNVSHNIATIKGKCRNMLQFYKEYPATSWHSVADRDLPKPLEQVLCIYGSNSIGIAWYSENSKCFYDAIYDEEISTVKYWMEIPQLTKESEIKNDK